MTNGGDAGRAKVDAYEPYGDEWKREMMKFPKAAMLEFLRNFIVKTKAENERLRGEVERLEKLVNTPHTHDWLEAVPLEAAHQIERWGTDHDDGKSPFDWFWLIGYLSQKAAQSAVAGDVEKAKHHTISTGACLLNWYRRMTGDDYTFQPGIATSKPQTLEAFEAVRKEEKG